MKKRWKIFWIVCGSMFLIGIICCSVSWGMGTTLTDIAHQFPHGISWVSEDKTYGDPDDDDDDDIDDDQEEDNETDTDDDQDEQKQEETAQAQEKANMKAATGVIEGSGKATYQNIHEIKSTVREGRIHLKTQSDTDEITVESKDTHEKLGFCAFAKNGTLYLTSNKKIKRIKNIGKGTITVTLPKDMELEKAELDLKAAARSVGEKSVAMIHVADINKVTGYVRGGCSPVGMKKQYTTVFDESVLSQPKVYVSGGRIGTQVCCAPADLIQAARATPAKIIF